MKWYLISRLVFLANLVFTIHTDSKITNKKITTNPPTIPYKPTDQFHFRKNPNRSKRSYAYNSSESLDPFNDLNSPYAQNVPLNISFPSFSNIFDRSNPIEKPDNTNSSKSLDPFNDLNSPYAQNVPLTISFPSFSNIFNRSNPIKKPDNTNSVPETTDKGRSFVIDYTNNQFLMDGKPFRYISGSFHSFRALPQTWRKHMKTMKAAGLNTLETYVEWSTNNPLDGVYKWDGIADVEQFVRIAAEEGFYVILRPGPFIAAERDMGGFPYWLLTKYPKIQLRTSDPNYLKEVRIWYEHLMPRMQPFLYGNGGPIIMVQVENEYGSNPICDKKYQEWLRDETEKYVKGNAVLFTNDIPVGIGCGKIPDVLATMDFPASPDIDWYWEQLRTYQPTGPLVCSEFYPGMITWWQGPFMIVDNKIVNDGLETILKRNASVNFYMFYGGTSFNFKTGANTIGPELYTPQITSYDFDAPMDEAGDPRPKFEELRKIIGKYLPIPDVPVPLPKPKMSIDFVSLEVIDVIFSEAGRQYLSSRMEKSRRTTTFEAFNQFSGFLLFEAKLPRFNKDPMVLEINGLHDRALIYVDRMCQGVLSRENKINKLPLETKTGEVIKILVENQGRITTGMPMDFKGILHNVTIDGREIFNWNITGYPFDDYKKIQDLIDSKLTQKSKLPESTSGEEYLHTGPAIYYGKFELKSDIYDTYLNPTGWRKGVAFVNGFNLGRYWPIVGPQITLFVPKELLKEGSNEVVLLELQEAPVNRTISFDSKPNLVGFNFPLSSNYAMSIWKNETNTWRDDST